MKKVSTSFLKVVILLTAIAVLAGMVWFPQAEGRAANLDLMSIYTDPFILFIYIASIPFFVGLQQAYAVVTLIETNRAFTPKAVAALKNMKLTSFSLIGCTASALLYIRFFAQGDDSAGPTALGIIASFAFAIIATAAAILQKLFQNAVDLKSENELTV